jgi:hypothetical protein
VLRLFRPRHIEWKANIVVWVTTVAVFLGTLVGGVLILFLFSQRDLIRELLRNPEKKRMERRTVARVEVELLSTDEPFINEITFTENVSRSGACVVTKTRWRPNEGVLVRSPGGEKRSRAKIAYCNDLPGDVFAVGLQFSSAVDNRVISRSGSSNYQAPDHPYRK